MIFVYCNSAIVYTTASMCTGPISSAVAHSRPRKHVHVVQCLVFLQYTVYFRHSRSGGGRVDCDMHGCVLWCNHRLRIESSETRFALHARTFLRSGKSSCVYVACCGETGLDNPKHIWYCADRLNRDDTTRACRAARGHSLLVAARKASAFHALCFL